MNPLIEKIRKEIGDHGPISFARFMELALYCPVYGYYEKIGDTLGRHGDFYTSVSVGPLFGELLALQFSAWLEELLTGTGSRSAGSFQVVEAGAHKADLARDILQWLKEHRNELFEAVEYCIVEPSDQLEAWQRCTLNSFQNKVRWVKSPQDLHPVASDTRPGVQGIIFSNELLDAMPVHRFGWDSIAKGWFEWGVTFEDGEFRWTRLEREKTQAPAWSEETLKQLPDGFSTEICPGAVQWWSDAARALHCGKLITIDYGLTAEEQLVPERLNGTLRAYHQQKIVSNILAEPGTQDITAHVDFSALCQAGERAGLKTEALLTQEQFLTWIATPIFEGKVTFGGEWTGQRTRQFQTLTHPEHLGRAFRVLIQKR